MSESGGVRATREECLRRAASVVLQAAIRIANEDARAGMSAEAEQANRNAARVFAVGAEMSRRMSPREAAEAAHYAGGPSVEELEARIEMRRVAERGRA